MPTIAPFRVRMHDRVDDAFREQYDRDGFAVLSRALSGEEVDALNAEAVQICRNTPLSGGIDLVEASVDLAEASDADVLRRFLCIHYPHKISELAAAAMRNQQILDTLTSVIGPNVKAMQSMLFVKSEGKPGQAWHQDEHFIPTRDRSLTAAWIALDDATIENGCLWVIPGSHRRGVLYPDRDQDDPQSRPPTRDATRTAAATDDRDRSGRAHLRVRDDLDETDSAFAVLTRSPIPLEDAASHPELLEHYGSGRVVPIEQLRSPVQLNRRRREE
jgi:Phytanoyl-CoA dioxygenase (PhyH)